MHKIYHRARIISEFIANIKITSMVTRELGGKPPQAKLRVDYFIREVLLKGEGSEWLTSLY
jgi:hypothetical protein